jgi:crotonobetainyl-CoA:carnitine CoA-transferase CaiB-like acyl-CoA transferase
VGGLTAAAWEALGGDPALLDPVRVTGDPDGLLPSRLAALEAMGAAVACATLAASVLDGVRTGGGPGTVHIDRRQVAVAARSERYVRPVTAARRGSPDGFAPLSRFWRTADGWVRLHGNYPWHRDRALEVLGVGTSDDDRDAVAAAVAAWRGSELEQALADAGAVGAVVRTPEEWAAGPAGAAVAGGPLVRRWTPRSQVCAVCNLHTATSSGRSADGLRVLDLTRVIAGPVATRTLAAWGADVLRLDPPHLPEVGAPTVDALVGKRSALLDVGTPQGRHQLEDLLGSADVLVHGYRPGSLDRHGLGSAELARRHPHLTVVSISAWGDAGPWAGRRGFDSIVQAACGIAVTEGSADRPGVLPAQVLDHATGYLAAAAAMLSVARTLAGGPPDHASLALAATARWLMSGEVPGRSGGVPVDATDRVADTFRTTVPGVAGADAAVSVIAPPGRVAGLSGPSWSRVPVHGGDPAAFQPR